MSCVWPCRQVPVASKPQTPNISCSCAAAFSGDLLVAGSMEWRVFLCKRRKIKIGVFGSHLFPMPRFVTFRLRYQSSSCGSMRDIIKVHPAPFFRNRKPLHNLNHHPAPRTRSLIPPPPNLPSLHQRNQDRTSTLPLTHTPFLGTNYLAPHRSISSNTFTTRSKRRQYTQQPRAICALATSAMPPQSSSTATTPLTMIRKLNQNWNLVTAASCRILLRIVHRVAAAACASAGRIHACGCT
jgi:hypothetical protein